MAVGIIWSVYCDGGHYMEYGIIGWHYFDMTCSGHYIEYDVLPCSERWAL